MNGGQLWLFHKSRGNGDLTDWKSISLCTFSKILELAVHRTLSLLFKNLLSPHQHGFVPDRSTTSNSVTFMSSASRAACQGSQLYVICFHLRKTTNFSSRNFSLTMFANLFISGWPQSYLLD